MPIRVMDITTRESAGHLTSGDKIGVFVAGGRWKWALRAHAPLRGPPAHLDWTR